MEHSIAVGAESSCCRGQVLCGTCGDIVAASCVVRAFLILRVDTLSVDIELNSSVHANSTGVLDIGHEQSHIVNVRVSVEGTSGLDYKLGRFWRINGSITKEQHTNDSGSGYVVGRDPLSAVQVPVSLISDVSFQVGFEHVQ